MISNFPSGLKKKIAHDSIHSVSLILEFGCALLENLESIEQIY